jgi:hypothetical protein
MTCQCGGNCCQSGVGESISHPTVSDLQEMRKIIRETEFSDINYMPDEIDQKNIVEFMLQTYLISNVTLEDLKNNMNKDKDIPVVSLSNNNYMNTWNSFTDSLKVGTTTFKVSDYEVRKSWFEKILDYLRLT